MSDNNRSWVTSINITMASLQSVLFLEKLQFAQLLADVFGHGFDALISIDPEDFSSAVAVELQERFGFGLEGYETLLDGYWVIIGSVACKSSVQ
mgnify:CR=1 FL=1